MTIYLSKDVPSDFLQYVSHMISNLPQSEQQDSVVRNLNEMLAEVNEKSEGFISFCSFIQREVQRNPTLQFWSQFLFKDCFAYIGLYLAICTGNWNLR